MNRKFLYLTKVSLRKKFKTKWFAITNIILAVAIVLFLNINSIVSFFGGDFDSKTKIIVVDNNTDSYSLFEKNIESYASTINSDEEDVKVTVKKSEENAKELKENLEDEFRKARLVFARAEHDGICQPVCQSDAVKFLPLPF